MKYTPEIDIDDTEEQVQCRFTFAVSWDSIHEYAEQRFRELGAPKGSYHGTALWLAYEIGEENEEGWEDDLREAVMAALPRSLEVGVDHPYQDERMIEVTASGPLKVGSAINPLSVRRAIREAKIRFVEEVVDPAIESKWDGFSEE